MTRTYRPAAVVAIGSLALLLFGCTGDNKPAADSGKDTASGGAAGASSVPKPTGKQIRIEMHSDDKGNYFLPKEVEAHPGDVLHYVLVTGAHNVHFVADSNKGAANLPAASAIAQLPDQAIDIPVNMAPGRYYFQCDPHALLGMVGHIKVEEIN